MKVNYSGLGFNKVVERRLSILGFLPSVRILVSYCGSFSPQLVGFFEEVFAGKVLFRWS